jgi:ABC-type branched-subunit amino acid transport system ATPase component/ABC-type branched-subunit amino acid transport system permease subunit
VSQHLVFLLLGLANGAVFASLALALVVTFRSSGVVNFATGAIALITAYTYAYLRQGELLILVPGLPQKVDLGTQLSFLPAAAISLVVAAALGLLLYGLVFRPLRTASPVAKAVASVGVSVVATALVLNRVGAATISVDSIFPRTIYKIGSVQISADRLWFAASIIGLTVLLSAAYSFTPFGLRTRAAAETEKGAYVSGISPDRIAVWNWMISSAVAGMAGILIAPISPIGPSSYTLFIVPALAAAIFGGFQRMAPAVAVGLAIGMLQSEATFLQTKYSWLPSSGLPELVPLVLIIGVLVVRAKPLPSRGALLQPTMGRAPRPARILRPSAIGTAVAILVLVVTHGDWRAAMVTSLIFGMISLSSVVVTGYAGQLSLAQLTLAGVGGFLLAPLTHDWHVPFPIAPLLAAFGATVIGVVVGLPALRIRGLPVAVVTLSLGVTLEAIWFRNASFVPSSGLAVADPTLFGLDLGPGSGAAFPRLSFCLMVLVFLVVVAAGVAKLRQSRLGNAMLAVRANERSAAATGVNVVRTKLAAFAIGAFTAGLGGALLSYKLGSVTFDSFDVLLGLGVFATVYLAGITSVSGGILAGVLGYGGVVFLATSRWLSLDSYWYQVITGIGLIASVIVNPEGLVGAVHRRLPARRASATSADRSLPTFGISPKAFTPQRASATRAHAGGPIALEVSRLGVRYGGVVAVNDVSFKVPRGAIVGLIGPNGAGKTTLIDAVSGFCQCTGSVTLDDVSLDGLAAYRRVRSGLGRSFQSIELWNDLTVTENVLVGHGTHRRTTDELDSLFGMLGLDEIRDRPAGELSQGERQLVSIARSLASKPDVILLDEPAAGLDSTESAWLGERLREVRNSGISILLVDHDMGLVLSLCDEVQVMDYGHLIAGGPPALIRADPAVTRAYLGSTHKATEATIG